MRTSDGPLRALPARSSLSSCRRAAPAAGSPCRRSFDHCRISAGASFARLTESARIRDQADRAFAEVDTFIQLLREAHRALRAEASLRAASCCSVEVVNGGDGLRLRCFLSIDGDESSAP